MESVITVVGSTLVIIRPTVNTPTVASGMFSMIRGMLLFFLYHTYVTIHGTQKQPSKLKDDIFFKSAKTKKSMDKIFVLLKSAFVCYIYC